jgi:hypothetical protein
MSELDSTDFRTVCRMLHCSQIERHALDLKTKRLELTITTPATLVFDGITQFRWQADSAAPFDRMEVSVVGLERLAADDVWRLYLHPCRSATLELSCIRITCNGAEVRGVGRQYYDDRPPGS